MNTSAIKTKILMVDDKPANLLALERLLKGLPVELFKATSGNEALRLTLHHDFALALLDIQMPEMDGYELAELLRQEEKTARMPFIFLSAIYTDHINIFKGYEKGAFSYIVKPFEPEILLNKVKLFIDMYQQEQSLRLRTEELLHVNQELEAFTYAVSHDLRAPLRAIHSFSQILEEDCHDRLNEQCQDYLARISRAVQRMDALINDLLSLSRVTRAELDISEIDLATLAGELIEQLYEQTPDRHVEVIIQRPLLAHGDIRLIRIAMENLLNNAWKYTTGTENPKIEVGQSKDDASVFYIRDNGVGFDMEYANKLFSPFQRLHPDEQFPGSGIGLATVQRIIRKHGGRIWGESSPGKGATFYMTLQRQAKHSRHPFPND